MRTRGTTRLQPAPTRERHVQHIGVVIPDLAGLPHPVSDGRALCHGHGHNPDLWTPDAADRNSRERAVTICGRCPIQVPCLDYARAARSQTVLWGIWGGRWFGERGEEATSG